MVDDRAISPCLNRPGGLLGARGPPETLLKRDHDLSVRGVEADSKCECDIVRKESSQPGAEARNSLFVDKPEFLKGNMCNDSGIGITISQRGLAIPVSGNTRPLLKR